jgi:hypothetical protein
MTERSETEGSGSALGLINGLSEKGEKQMRHVFTSEHLVNGEQICRNCGATRREVCNGSYVLSPECAGRAREGKDSNVIPLPRSFLIRPFVSPATPVSSSQSIW